MIWNSHASISQVVLSYHSKIHQFFCWLNSYIASLVKKTGFFCLNFRILVLFEYDYSKWVLDNNQQLIFRTKLANQAFLKKIISFPLSLANASLFSVDILRTTTTCQHSDYYRLIVVLNLAAIQSKTTMYHSIFCFKRGWRDSSFLSINNIIIN